jgi:hypothetical protein
VALVIGAGCDPGLAVAGALVEAGVRSLALVDLDEIALADAVGALAGDAGATAVRGHRLARADAVNLAVLFADVRHEHGPLDIVVHVDAGGPSDWPTASLAVVERVVGSSVATPLAVTRLAVGEMTGGGIVVLVGAASPATDALTAAGRGAVAGLVTACAASPPAPGVHVAAVLPAGAVLDPKAVAVTVAELVAGDGTGIHTV